MADSSSASAKLVKPSPSSGDEHVNKQKKMEFPTYSDPKSLVTFLVGPGPNPVEFLIHKESICHHSNVLAAVFNGSLKDGRTQTYRLEHATIDAFKLFMQWIYSGKLMLIQTGSNFKPGMDTEGAISEDISLAELWILAGKFAIPPLQNAALDAMNEILQKCAVLPVQTFKYIYENTSKESPLRMFFVEVCVASLEEVSMETTMACPKVMLADIFRRFVAKRASCIEEMVVVSDFYIKDDGN